MDESNADDGAIHGFWTFILARRARGEPADVENVVKLLLLILLYEMAKTP